MVLTVLLWKTQRSGFLFQNEHRTTWHEMLSEVWNLSKQYFRIQLLPHRKYTASRLQTLTDSCCYENTWCLY